MTDLHMDVRAEIQPSHSDLEEMGQELGHALQTDLYDVVWSYNDETVYLVKWVDLEEEDE